jgi:hypothetical protein
MLYHSMAITGRPGVPYSRALAIRIALLRFLSRSCDSDRTLAIPIALLRFEGPTPGWFSRPSGQGGFQPMTPSLLDLSQTVLVPVSDFIRPVVAVPSAAQPVLRFARLYHLTAVSQGTTAGGFQVSGFQVSGCGAVMPAATTRSRTPECARGGTGSAGRTSARRSPGRTWVPRPGWRRSLPPAFQRSRRRGSFS